MSAGKHAVVGAVPRRRQRLVHLAIDEFDIRLPIAGLLDHVERWRRRVALPNLAYQPAFLQFVAFSNWVTNCTVGHQKEPDWLSTWPKRAGQCRPAYNAASPP